MRRGVTGITEADDTPDRFDIGLSLRAWTVRCDGAVVLPPVRAITMRTPWSSHDGRTHRKCVSATAVTPRRRPSCQRAVVCKSDE